MPPPPNPRLDWPWLDEAIHFVLFGGIAGLGWLAALPGRAMCIGVVALAALTELGQGLLPWDRRPDVVDFGFDLVGAALGWVLAWSLARLSQGARART